MHHNADIIIAAQLSLVLLGLKHGRYFRVTFELPARTGLTQEQPEVQTAVMQWPDATSGGLEGISNEKVPT